MTGMEELEFEGMLEGVLRVAANPEVPEGFAERMTAGLRREAAVEASIGFSAKDEAERGNAMAEAGVLAGGGMREIGVLGSIWESVREMGARRRMAPLVLESRPVAVVDRMAGRREFGAFGWAVAAHGVALLVLGLLVATKPRAFQTMQAMVVTLVEAPAPMKMRPRAQMAGGGGGQRGSTPVAQGRLPKFAETQMVTPKAPPLVQPKLAVEPTVVMQRDLKMAENTLTNLGLPNSAVVGTGSLGNGSGTGIGSGNGAGAGMGSGGNTGGGALRIGGGVSAPVPLSMPDPEFSEEARKAKVSGNVLVYLWVDPQGHPTHVRVLRGIGMGLDEKAMAAVRQYRFKPALRGGVPVTVEMNVEVNFQIF